jgi:hypothetical protein
MMMKMMLTIIRMHENLENSRLEKEQQGQDGRHHNAYSSRRLLMAFVMR